MFGRHLSLGHIEDFREECQQGSVGCPFHRWSSEFYFKRIAMRTGNLATFCPWLDVQRKNKPLAAAVTAEPSIRHVRCIGQNRRETSRSMPVTTNSSNWINTSTKSGERSMLPMGGMRDWNIPRNGRVKLSSSGASGLYGLIHESIAWTIMATMMMYSVVLIITTRPSSASPPAATPAVELKW